LRGLAFDKVVRWARPERWRTLARRPDGDLPFVGDEAQSGNALLLDTTVYIDRMQGNAPTSSRDSWTCGQSTTAPSRSSNYAHRRPPRSRAWGNPLCRDPDQEGPSGHAGTSAVRTGYRDPARAAALAGILARTQGYAAGARLRALHDCVLFLQALKLGFTILTRNIKDYDFLLQMVPDRRPCSNARKPKGTKVLKGRRHGVRWRNAPVIRKRPWRPPCPATSRDRRVGRSEKLTPRQFLDSLDTTNSTKSPRQRERCGEIRAHDHAKRAGKRALASIEAHYGWVMTNLCEHPQEV